MIPRDDFISPIGIIAMINRTINHGFDSRDDFTSSPIVIMMIKTMMFQDRICSHMIELTLVVFVSRVACSCPVRVGASLLALLFPSWLIEEGVYTHLLGSCSDSWFKERGIEMWTFLFCCPLSRFLD